MFDISTDVIATLANVFVVGVGVGDSAVVAHSMAYALQCTYSKCQSGECEQYFG